jgi:hypothetical protein
LDVLPGAGLVLADPLAESLALTEALPLAESLPLAEPLPLPERLGAGENVGVDGEDPEQPATEAEPRTARVAKPAAASLALCPVRALGVTLMALTGNGLFIIETLGYASRSPSGRRRERRHCRTRGGAG